MMQLSVCADCCICGRCWYICNWNKGNCSHSKCWAGVIISTLLLSKLSIVYKNDNTLMLMLMLVNNFQANNSEENIKAVLRLERSELLCYCFSLKVVIEDMHTQSEAFFAFSPCNQHYDLLVFEQHKKEK